MDDISSSPVDDTLFSNSCSGLHLFVTHRCYCKYNPTLGLRILLFTHIAKGALERISTGSDTTVQYKQLYPVVVFTYAQLSSLAFVGDDCLRFFLSKVMMSVHTRKLAGLCRKKISMQNEQKTSLLWFQQEPGSWGARSKPLCGHVISLVFGCYSALSWTGLAQRQFYQHCHPLWVLSEIDAYTTFMDNAVVETNVTGDRFCQGIINATIIYLPILTRARCLHRRDE
jgi:hypothetical protein